jgi:hypothetical protein
MQRLEEMGVYDLPDYEEVVGYSTGGTDEGWQWVEYATKEKYRHYNYPFPGIYEKAGAERKQFEGIIRFIENEFDISH